MYHAERMPEQIRLQVGGVTHEQVAVYEEFQRYIPGFAPPKEEYNMQQQQQQQQQPQSGSSAQVFFRNAQVCTVFQ